MYRTRKWATGIAVATVALVSLGVPLASASTDSSPKLRVSADRLEKALECHELGGGTGSPVLLIHGTTSQGQKNFDWNYEPALRDLDRPYCTLNLPNNGTSDIQISAEYVVDAIRTMYDEADRKVTIIGWSQGGMIGRWALKYFPDTRDKLEEIVGLASSNHGTKMFNTYCAARHGCPEAFWQQSVGSKFLTELNSGQETYPGIDYTEIYTYTDEIVVPNLPSDSSSSLSTKGPGHVRNVAVQSICPGHVADHFMLGSTDPVAFALAKDAITHDGPADKSRIDRAVCTKAVMPAVNPTSLLLNESRFLGASVGSMAKYKNVPAEPKLAGYVKDHQD
ncbi:esterase/lipase family protein [Pseudonocardia spinosispora]|uniref:esterase/lipase family protein n=1 Tax=Pseudonocardia spinosispora TaxID=103441 RepID=UPI00056C0065|nr:alpha/beta fold hydrolase [Pseudonocardia spinosispora]